MTGYQALDLAAYCSAGAELLAGDQEPRLGSRVFHGLPFRIGEGSRAFTAFGARSEQAAMHHRHQRPGVISRRRTPAPRLEAHDQAVQFGEVVATYVVRLSDGSEPRVPIRERFEIADMALADDNSLQERWGGPGARINQARLWRDL